MCHVFLVAWRHLPQAFRLSPVPIRPLRQGDVPRSDWPFPSNCTPLLPYTVRLHYELASHLPSVCRSGDAAPRFFGARILPNILITSYRRCQKGVPTNLYGGGQYGARWSRSGYLTITIFLVQLLAASMTMAVSNLVESSSALPIYKSPWCNDFKNTALHIPAFDSISCRHLHGSTK